MSQVNAADFRIISSADDVIENYAGAGQDAKMGVEVELAFFDPAVPDLPSMNVAQNEALSAEGTARYKGDWIRIEPTAETMEINSAACTFDKLPKILADTQDKIGKLTALAAEMGLKRSFFSDLPDKTHLELLQNVVNVDRYEAFFKPPREDMMDIAAYFSVCKSNQVSVSYRDPDHMLGNVRRLYALAPFLFMMSDNTSGFAEGQPVTYHHGMHYRRHLHGRGGCPCYVFSAQSGEEYLDAHIHHVMNNPLYVYYDEAGILHRIPSGVWMTMNTLKEQGLNTASNFHLSESILWPDVKLAALKNKDEQVVAHRYEARMFGVGLHQHNSAALIVGALAFDEDFAAKIDELLASFGFDFAKEEETRLLVRESYMAAYQHNNQYFEIAYGNGRMSDFAQRFADILEGAADKHDFSEMAAPILKICRSGMTDAKVNHLLLPTLQDVRDLQKSYDPALFENPYKCNADIFADRLKNAA